MTNQLLSSAWEEAQRHLETADIGPANAAFLKQIHPLGQVENTVLLSAPNQFTKTLLETQLSEPITRTLSTVLNSSVRIAVTVENEAETAGSAEVSLSTNPQVYPQTVDNSGEVSSESTNYKQSYPQIVDKVVDSSESTIAELNDFLTANTGDPLPYSAPTRTTVWANSVQNGQPDNPPQSGTANTANEISLENAPENEPVRAVNRGGAAGKIPDSPSKPATPEPSKLSREQVDQAHLNSKYTFENFVTGPSNRFAYAAAEAIAEAPARAYNPVFIYGGPGLGKTHLLHAIGNYALHLYPHLRVHYVNSEEFTNDFINAIRSDHTKDFQLRYRNVDILLIDDIQFIQGKEQTMEEFFHTFNALHNANKQIVITSDLPPKLLPGLEDRLRSRFEWGLITDIQPPDLETRIAILQMKAAAEKLLVPQEVLTYIATRISSNIRELEGALLRVTAFANLTKQQPDANLAEMVLKDILSDPEEMVINPTLILGQTASYFDMSIDQLISSDRSRKVVEARQIAMYLCRELTNLSLPKIGDTFGGRDHSTVMHANKKIQKMMNERRDTYTHVTELTSRIKQKARDNY